MIVMGLDISSVQLNACVLNDDMPPYLLAERIGKSSEPLIERVRRVRGAVSNLAVFGEGSRAADPAKYGGHMATEFFPIVPDWIVVEDAFGRFRKADRALHFITGAIVACAPADSQVALVRAFDWRAAIGATNTKPAGHAAVLSLLSDRHASPDEFDGHELDAIGIAYAWKRILEQQDVAA